MSRAMVVSNYQGLQLSFSEEGWFNATAAADKFGKRVDHWLANDETKAYILALSGFDNTRNVGDYNSSLLRDLIKTKRGKNGGTWLHPDLAVAFARWLDVRFAIWCDRQIRAIIAGNHPHYDWKQARSVASSSFKVMSDILKLARESIGKETCRYHYSNEAKMINRVLAGASKDLDRDSLTQSDLDLLGKLENKNAVMIAQGIIYDERKVVLKVYAAEIRTGLAIDHESTRAGKTPVAI